MAGEGNPNAKLMLVGEAPGGVEDEQGSPFLGPAGRLLNTALSRAGVSREDLFLTNSVRCRPPKNDLKRFPSAVGACSIWLQEDIDEIQPRAVLAVGGTALKALTGKASVGKERWKVLSPLPKVHLGDAKVMCTWHPAYILRQPEEGENPTNGFGSDKPERSLIDDLVEDITVAWRLANFDYDALPEHKRIILMPGYSMEQLVDALTAIAAPLYITIDCEWTAAKDHMCWPWTPGAELYSIGIAARTGPNQITSVSLAWPPPAGGREYLRSFLEQRQHVLHFGYTDGLWMSHEGLPLVMAWDTGFGGFCLDETWRLGLEHLAPLVGGMPPGWKVEKRWYERPRLSVEWSGILAYQGDDCYAEQLTFEGEFRLIKQRPTWEQNGIKRVATQIMIPAAVEFIDDARTGLPVSVDKINIHLTNLASKEQELGAAFAQDIGGDCSVEDAISYANNTTLTAQYVKQKYGIDLPSTNKYALEELAALNNQQPDIQRVIDIRHIQKLRGTYLLKWKLLAERQGDGSLHCITSLTTKTGRTAQETEEGGGPQVTPRGDGLRDVVTAPEGWKIGMADESQLELRVIAELAPERRMREVYAAGDPKLSDLHMTTGTFFKLAETNPGLDVMYYWDHRLEFFEQVGEWKLGGDGLWGWKSPVRQAGKGSNFALAYGAKEEKYQWMSLHLYNVELDIEQATWGREQHFKLYPDLLAWHERAKDDFRRGFYVTPSGRMRRHFSAPTEAINGPIQSFGNDIVLLARIAIGEEIRARKLTKWIKPITYIHDAIGVLVKDEVVDECREIVTRNMEHPPLDRIGVTSWSTPLVAEFSTSQSWSH